MSDTYDVHCVTIALPDTATGWQANDVVGHAFKAPAATDGGGITILRAWSINAAATSAATSHALQLENWGTAGTAIKANGTIAAALGGTADPYAANVPKAFVFAQPRMAAGEWLVIRKTETNSSDPTRGVIVLEYQVGL